MLDEIVVPSNVSNESIKIIGESIGISGIGDDVARELAEDITYRLKSLVQDGLKFTHHGKRKRFTIADFDNALKTKNIEPVHGVHSNDHIPWRLTSGGGRDLHFLEDKELEVSDLVNQQLPKLPVLPNVKSHWLAIEGVQPTIPENPAPVSKNIQKQDAVDPASKLSATNADSRNSRNIHGRGLKSVETVRVKQLATHELSAEQQLYYKEITEACVGSDESKRGEALNSLSHDPGLHQMVARLCTFIAEGVRVNVVQRNLALLIYLMRMTKALLDNTTLYLEKYLHELTPSVLTCIVSRQLCLKPDMDNHWALRDFAARLMSQICRHYNTTTNGLQTRITRVFTQCLTNENTPLSTVYGAGAGLCELGPEVIKAIIIPKLKVLGIRIEQSNESVSSYEKTAAAHIKSLLTKSVPPILKSYRSPPDNAIDYKNEFGYLGAVLQSNVIKLRQAPSHNSVPMTQGVMSGIVPTSTPGTLRNINSPMSVGQRINIQPGRTVMMSTSGGATKAVMQQPISSNQPQKLVILNSRTPVTQNQMLSGDSQLKMSDNISVAQATSADCSVAPKFVFVKTEPKDDDYGM